MARAHYLLGLSYLGKGNKGAARAEMEKVLEFNAFHVWARQYLGGPLLPPDFPYTPLPWI